MSEGLTGTRLLLACDLFSIYTMFPNMFSLSLSQSQTEIFSGVLSYFYSLAAFFKMYHSVKIFELSCKMLLNNSMLLK